MVVKRLIAGRHWSERSVKSTVCSGNDLVHAVANALQMLYATFMAFAAKSSKGNFCVTDSSTRQGLGGATTYTSAGEMIVAAGVQHYGVAFTTIQSDHAGFRRQTPNHCEQI